ncbi:MAG TPA: NTP transferase domain-containing protein [Mycobacteriales bacterium]
MGKTAGIVLAGGRSSRMGRPKAALEWHGSTLLFRTAAVLRRAVDGPVVVVRAAAQELPDLPDGVEVVDDPVQGLGPMQGVAAGLGAVRDRAGAAFVCSTDLPFLHPAYVRAVLRGLDDPAVDLVLPTVRGYRQPLAAGYRTGLTDLIEAQIAAGNLRPGMLLTHCTATQPDEAALLGHRALAAADPELDSVANINTPEDYEQARARPGPAVPVECFGALAKGDRRGPRTVPAASLGEAAAAVGLALDRHVVAAVDGEQIVRDPRAPLVAGDTVAFLSADAGG